MQAATASAPGKLMLFGDHAVVYGYPCIATAVDLRIAVSAEARRGDEVEIRTPELPTPYVGTVLGLMRADVLPKEVNFVARAIRRFWEHCGETFGVRVSTQNGFGRSYGLGSSSAVTVATVKALSSLAGLSMGPREVFELGYEAVREGQGGIGSGFDVAAASYGGTLCFVAGGELVEPVLVHHLPLVVAYSGVKADTVSTVRRVAEYRQTHPGEVESIMEEMGGIVLEGKRMLEAGDLSRLGELMDLNHNLLRALGVSTDELDRLVSAARAGGAFGAKLSGAGGGDCMIALADNDNKSSVETAIERAGVPGATLIPVEAGAEGVRIEQQELYR